MNSTMQKFQHEEFGAIRTIEIDGEPWFVGRDVASALGYRNTKDALHTHVDAEDKRIFQRSENATFEIPPRGFTIINESGLYSLILSSKLPAAKKFRRWVTSEILPSIRRHGAYITDEQLDNLLRDPELAFNLFCKLQTERKKRTELENRLETQAPKVRYYDIILQCKNAVPVSLIAKDYGMSAISFNRLLHDLGIQYRVGPTWLPYQKYTGKGYTVSRTYFTGGGIAVLHTCWTQKGRLFLYDALGYYGIYPNALDTGAVFH